MCLETPARDISKLSATSVTRADDEASSPIKPRRAELDSAAYTRSSSSSEYSTTRLNIPSRHTPGAVIAKVAEAVQKEAGIRVHARRPRTSRGATAAGTAGRAGPTHDAAHAR